MIHHRNNVVTAGGRRELLGERLAGDAGERGVVENARLPNRAHLRWLVNKRHANCVFARANVAWRRHHRPPILPRRSIERIDQVLQ